MKIHLELQPEPFKPIITTTNSDAVLVVNPNEGQRFDITLIVRGRLRPLFDFIDELWGPEDIEAIRILEAPKKEKK